MKLHFTKEWFWLAYPPALDSLRHNKTTAAYVLNEWLRQREEKTLLGKAHEDYQRWAAFLAIIKTYIGCKDFENPADVWHRFYIQEITDTNPLPDYLVLALIAATSRFTVGERVIDYDSH